MTMGIRSARRSWSITELLGAGPPYSGWVEDATARGARLIAYDRPGYGASTAVPGRTIGDAALDAASIMDALGVHQFATWGVSGGGPHALACAALLPDRVTAACSIAGVGPFDADGLNYFNGMGHDNLVEFGLAMAGREHIAAFVTATAAEMLENLEDLASSIQTLVAEPDRRALGGPIGRWWADGLGVSFSAGADGWIDDDLAFVKPFGFEIGAISRPTLVLHGHLDLLCPHQPRSVAESGCARSRIVAAGRRGAPVAAHQPGKPRS